MKQSAVQSNGQEAMHMHEFSACKLSTKHLHPVDTRKTVISIREHRFDACYSSQVAL